uniref:RNA-directed DNA polymerase n=1 Tax=Globodera pallida TaxID=36090 RepID=A0A183C354_GLOPA
MAGKGYRSGGFTIYVSSQQANEEDKLEARRANSSDHKYSINNSPNDDYPSNNSDDSTDYSSNPVDDSDSADDSPNSDDSTDYSYQPVDDSDSADDSTQLRSTLSDSDSADDSPNSDDSTDYSSNPVDDSDSVNDSPNSDDSADYSSSPVDDSDFTDNPPKNFLAANNSHNIYHFPTELADDNSADNWPEHNGPADLSAHLDEYTNGIRLILYEPEPEGPAPTEFLGPEDHDEESPTTVVTKRETGEDTETIWKEENLDHENSRMNYLGWKIHRDNVQGARERWTTDCHHRNNALSIAKGVARQMPEEAARSLYKRDDITAFWAKPSLSGLRWTISLCRQTKVEEVNWEQKIQNKCFLELPVIVARQTFFVKPGTRDLAYNGTEVHCDKQGNNPWAKSFNDTEEEELHKANDNHRFRSEQFINRQNPLLFTRGSIFETEQARLEQSLKDLSIRVTRPELEVPDVEIIEGNRTGTRGNSISGVFAIGEILVDSAQREGEKLRKKVEETVAKGKEWMEDPIGIIKYLKWIFFTTIAVLIFVGSTVLLWKIRIYAAALTIPLRMLRSIGSTLASCFPSGRDLANRVRNPIVMEVELGELPKPSAPPEEPSLEQKAYVLSYMPKICQINQFGRKKKRCYLNLAINGRNIKALFDTGADVTYIGLSTATQFLLNIKRGDFPQARAANSTAIHFIGSAMVDIKLGDFEGKFPILVSDDGSCPCAAIIGTDLMDRISEHGEEEIGLNFKRGLVRVGHIHLPMIAAVHVEKQPIEIRLHQSQTLPPLSDSFAWGRINRNLAPDEAFITQEREHNYFPLRVGKCLTSPGSTRVVPLRLLNFGNSVIKVHEGSRLANLESMEEGAQINSLKKETDKDDPKMVMTDEEWRKFKLESNHISPEADWTEETLTFPRTEEKRKPVVERLSLEEAILSPTGLEKLKKIIEKNEKAFVNPGEVGLFRGKTIHRIDLIDGARPFQQRPYNYPVALQPEIERQVKELLRQRVIRPSTSAWSSPIVLVKKPDGSYRFCVDYRKLNQVTKRSTYYLPRIQSILDEVSGKKFFSVADCSSGFFHIKLAKGHEERSAFICHMGLFEWLRCPFGLAGAPTTFQRAMEEVRQTCSATFLVYLDDCIIGSMTEDEHLNDINTFLKTMTEVGFRLKPEKCRFAMGEIRYLGHLISAKGVRIDQKDVEPIQRLKKPTNITELRSLIGALSYFRKFIYGFAEILQPIYELTKNESTTAWGTEHDRALEELKERLTTAPVLAPPRFGKPFVVETDASLKAIAGCLLQKNLEEETHPICYFSRVLTKHEKRYSVVELEALAICASLKNFRPYLEGAGKSTVITDNSALTSLFRRKDLEGRLSRYQLAIMAFDVEIVHRPGKKNKFCDHLSRYLANNAEQQVNWLKVEPKITREEMRAEQIKDVELKKIRAELEDERKTQKEGELRRWNFCDGILCAMDRGEWKACVPKSLRCRMMEEFHADAFQGAHLGEKRTKEKIRRNFFWEGMEKDVRKFVQSCDACQRRKIIGIQQSVEPICPIEPASRPGERLHLDLMGPLRTAKGGFQYILMIVDSFSKYLTAIPLREQTATTVTSAFVDKFLCIFGLPKIVVTDCGTQFLSATFESLAETWGFKHQTTVPYHQSANGQVERYNRTLADMLVTTCGGTNWASALPMLCFAYNSSLNSQIEQTPFFVMHGFDPRLPSETAFERSRENYSDMAVFARELTVRMEEVRQKVAENLAKCATQMKSQQKRVKEIPWTEGMLVLLRKVDKKHKLEQNYEGPYRVMEISKPNLTLKNLSPDDPRFEAHMDRCKPYFEQKKEDKEETEKGIIKRGLGDSNLEESEEEEEEEMTTVAFLSQDENFVSQESETEDDEAALMAFEIENELVWTRINSSNDYEPSTFPENLVRPHWEVWSEGGDRYLTTWVLGRNVQLFLSPEGDQVHIGSEIKTILSEEGKLFFSEGWCTFWETLEVSGQIFEEIRVPELEMTHCDWGNNEINVNFLRWDENETKSAIKETIGNQPARIFTIFHHLLMQYSCSNVKLKQITMMSDSPSNSTSPMAPSIIFSDDEPEEQQSTVARPYAPTLHQFPRKDVQVLNCVEAARASTQIREARDQEEARQNVREKRIRELQLQLSQLEEERKKEEEEEKKKEAQEKAKKEANAAKGAEAQAKRKEKEEEAKKRKRKEAEEKAKKRKEVEEKKKKEAEEKKKKLKVVKEKREAEVKKKREAERKKREEETEEAEEAYSYEEAARDLDNLERMLEEKKRKRAAAEAKEAEDKAKKEEEAKKAGEKARKEAEIKAKKEEEAKKAGEKARKEAEIKAKKEAEAKKAEEKARKEEEEKAKKSAEEKAKKNAEEKARKEAENRAKKEAEDKAKKEAEAKAEKEAEDKIRKEAEDKPDKGENEKAKCAKKMIRDALAEEYVPGPIIGTVLNHRGEEEQDDNWTMEECLKNRQKEERIREERKAERAQGWHVQTQENWKERSRVVQRFASNLIRSTELDMAEKPVPEGMRERRHTSTSGGSQRKRGRDYAISPIRRSAEEAQRGSLEEKLADARRMLRHATEILDEIAEELRGGPVPKKRKDEEQGGR